MSKWGSANDPYSIGEDGVVVCLNCGCEAQVLVTSHRPPGIRDYDDKGVVTVRCPNPGCDNYTGRAEPMLGISARFGGDKVTCPECGKDMDPDAAQDEIWHCVKCKDTYGLDDDWYLETIPTEPDVDHYIKSQKEMKAEREAEKEVE